MRKKGREWETPEQRIQEEEMGHRAQLQQSQGGDWGIQAREARETECPNAMEQEMQRRNL